MDRVNKEEIAFQAVLPLRGKILNVERKDEQAMYKNTEIQSMVTALGLGVMGEDFNANNLRYSKIIILTDADVDEFTHIRNALLTFLYRYQKRFSNKDTYAVAVPPLYKVEWERKSEVLLRRIRAQEALRYIRR